MGDSNRETTDQLNIKFDDKGLVPAIVQDIDSGEILMMAWMNEAALKQTLEVQEGDLLLPVTRQDVGQGRKLRARPGGGGDARGL